MTDVFTRRGGFGHRVHTGLHVERRQLCEDTETQGERHGTAKADEDVTRPHASDAKEGRFWPSSLLSCEGITF